MRLIEPPPNALLLFGMPTYSYAYVLREVIQWLRAVLSNEAAQAFLHESRVRDLLSYIAETYRLHRKETGRTHGNELKRFFASYLEKRAGRTLA